jgi:hypothetical protein
VPDMVSLGTTEPAGPWSGARGGTDRTGVRPLRGGSALGHPNPVNGLEVTEPGSIRRPRTDRLAGTLSRDRGAARKSENNRARRGICQVRRPTMYPIGTTTASQTMLSADMSTVTDVRA